MTQDGARRFPRAQSGECHCHGVEWIWRRKSKRVVRKDSAKARGLISMAFVLSVHAECLLVVGATKGEAPKIG